MTNYASIHHSDVYCVKSDCHLRVAPGELILVNGSSYHKRCLDIMDRTRWEMCERCQNLIAPDKLIKEDGLPYHRHCAKIIRETRVRREIQRHSPWDLMPHKRY